MFVLVFFIFFFFQAEDGIRDLTVTGVQTCALPICAGAAPPEGPHLRLGVHLPRPEDAALRGLRGAPGRVSRLSRQPALRVLRFPQVRARPAGRPEIHCFDLKAFSRIADSVVAGVIASGSILSSMIAGLPEALARSNAGAKSAVRSTVSPWPP